LHGRAHADQLHGTNRAAETGMNAELDLGQTETHPPVVTGDAIAARKREFQASAQCEAVDRSGRGAGESGEAIEDTLTGTDQLVGPRSSSLGRRGDRYGR